jgi:hypothetical protein
MKKLLIALVLVSCNALADTWVMNNAGGGQVVLTDRVCKGHPSLREAYTYTNSVYLEGCWTLLDGKIHVAWNKNQGRKVYEINNFVPDQVTPKKKGTSL